MFKKYTQSHTLCYTLLKQGCAADSKACVVAKLDFYTFVPVLFVAAGLVC